MSVDGGAVPEAVGARETNLLLEALPADERGRLCERAREVPLRFRQVLIQPGDEIVDALFPLSGVVSLVTMTPSGRSVETSQVGREGMLGLPAFLGVKRFGLEAVVQVGGRALAIPIRDLRAATFGDTNLDRVLKRYTYARLIETAQNAACNRLHSLEERAARWLLETYDRVPGKEFRITHEFLATLLGVQRPRVTEAAVKLQRDGLVEYGRGRIRLLDPPALRAAACECYTVVRDELRALVTATTT